MTRFSDIVMDHFDSPRNRGHMLDCHATGQGSFGGGPPRVTIFLRSRLTCVESATFEAEGCGVTIACASRLTELVIGKPLNACRELVPECLMAELGGLPADKHYCAWIAIEALRAALDHLPTASTSND
ncbi:MAG: iron-sulfur cluster assembly scaffold protein [Pirellulales bacterium]